MISAGDKVATNTPETLLPMLDRLLEYDAWATTQVAMTLMRIGAEDGKSEEMARATVTLGHVLAAHRVWQERCGGEPADGDLWPMPDLASVEAQTHALRLAWMALLASRDLTELIQYHNAQGGPYENALGDIVMHVITHGNYHRGQIALLLGRHDHTPPVTDFIYAVRTGQLAADQSR